MYYTITPFNECGLFLSYQCSSQCQHCSYACDNEWQEWLTPDDADLIFQSLKGCLNDCWYLHLTGGEPFLNFSRALAIIAVASRHQMLFHAIETNASWCVDENTVRAKLVALKNAGITSILISCTPYHAEFIPLARVLLAKKVAQEVFDRDDGFVLVYLENCMEKIGALDMAHTVPVKKYVDAYGPDAVVSCFPDKYKLALSGRAAYSTVPDYIEKFPARQFKDDACTYELFQSRHIHIDPYGNTFPNFCAGISLGDAKAMNTWFPAFDCSAYPLLEMLAVDGPYGLLHFAKKQYAYEEPQGGFHDKCHLCVDVRRHIVECQGEFKELAPIQFYKRLARYHKEKCALLQSSTL